MSRRRAVAAVSLGLFAAVLPAACGGGDDNGAVTGTAPSNESTPPRSSAPPPSAFGGLPPTLVQCFADEGFDLSSPTAIHSAPPRVVNKCFAELHQGGAVP
jgi:hypothetical protein